MNLRVRNVSGAALRRRDAAWLYTAARVGLQRADPGRNAVQRGLDPNPRRSARHHLLRPADRVPSVLHRARPAASAADRRLRVCLGTSGSMRCVTRPIRAAHCELVTGHSTRGRSGTSLHGSASEPRPPPPPATTATSSPLRLAARTMPGRPRRTSAAPPAEPSSCSGLQHVPGPRLPPPPPPSLSSSRCSTTARPSRSLQRSLHRPAPTPTTTLSVWPL